MAQRIMVINDTPEILDLFRELLTDEGFEVFLYSFAVKDLGEVEHINPDLIILDYVFGSETLGWQFLQKLKMRRSTAQIPVIICTAAVKAVREIEGYLKAKGIEVVPKPFDIEDLLAAVRSALENREYIASLQEPDAQEDEEAPSNGESLITKPLRHGNPLDNDGDD